MNEDDRLWTQGNSEPEKAPSRPPEPRPEKDIPFQDTPSREDRPLIESDEPTPNQIEPDESWERK